MVCNDSGLRHKKYGHGMFELLRLLRPRQWVKNAFVAAPLFFTPDRLGLDSIVLVLMGFVAFSMVSSSVYILNDYLDRESDRQHPVKCKRPLAAGTVPSWLALLTMVALASGGFWLADKLIAAFFDLLLLYLTINLLYSNTLKQVAIVDILCIAIGFVIRVEAGAALIDVTPSVWIINSAGLLALFLALAKRRDDLVRELDSSHRASLKGYNLPYLDVCVSMVLGALLISYMMYTTDIDVANRLQTDQLYLTVPFVIAGIMRYLQITLVEQRSGSPTEVVTSDPLMIASILGWVLCYGALAYT